MFVRCVILAPMTKPVSRGTVLWMMCAVVVACSDSDADDDVDIDAAVPGIDADTRECSATSPCSGGLVCKDDACVACVDEEDDDLCGAGMLCVGGGCIAGECRVNADCTDQACTDNACGSCIDPIPGTPRSRWPADGDAADVVGSNSGTLVGGVSFAPGVKCSALSFDGVDDAVAVATPSELPLENDPRTIALWIKVDTFEHDDEIVVWGNDVTAQKSAIALKSIPEQGGPTVFFWGFFTDIVSDTTMDTDTWYHVAFTFDGTTGTLYLDGEVVGTAELTLNTPDVTEFRIGSGLDGAGDSFAGDVDDLLIYGRALSAGEVAELAAAR